MSFMKIWCLYFVGLFQISGKTLIHTPRSNVVAVYVFILCFIYITWSVFDCSLLYNSMVNYWKIVSCCQFCWFRFCNSGYPKLLLVGNKETYFYLRNNHVMFLSVDIFPYQFISFLLTDTVLRLKDLKNDLYSWTLLVHQRLHCHDILNPQ